MMSIESWAEALGAIEKREDKLIVKVDIYSIQAYSTLISFSILTAVFSVVGLAVLVSSIDNHFMTGLKIALSVWTLMIIFIGVPLLVMRWSVRNLKYDIEDELERIRTKHV